MSDFASSAMLRVLHAGMRRQGLAAPAQAWLKSARVPLDAKRQLVGQVLAQRGWLGVLRLGEGVQDVGGEVLLDYLAASKEPVHILQSWMRLERYVHSKHRTRLDIFSARHVQMHHYSLVEGQSPEPAEDVVVLGVLLGLLQRCRLTGLRFSWGNDSPDCAWTANAKVDSALGQALKNGQTSHWQIQWNGFKHRPPAPNLPRLLSQSNIHYGWGTWSERVAKWGKQQLMQSHVEALSLDLAARALNLSARSLQRHLQTEGLRFVDVMGQVRVVLAGALLAQEGSALAQVGFASGFSDQAHFCREFKRRIGVSPLQFQKKSWPHHHNISQSKSKSP